MGRQDKVNGYSAAAGIVALLAALWVGCKPSSQPEVKPARPEGVKQSEKEDIAMTLSVKSPAFANGEAVPERFTGDGEDVSPELKWSDVPNGAKELALIMDDPDAPTPEPWVHWVICKIPAAARDLPENVAKKDRPEKPAGSLQGKNSWGRIGYGGPAPPRGHGVHHYHFKLYALDTTLDVKAGLDKKALLAAMEGHVIATGELVGKYQR